MELSEWDTMDTGYDSIGRIRVPSSYKKMHKKAKIRARDLSRAVAKAGAWMRARMCLGISQTYSQYMAKLVALYRATSYDFARDDYEDALKKNAPDAEVAIKKERVDASYKQANIIVQKYIALYKCLLNKTIEWEEARQVLRSGYTGGTRLVRAATSFTMLKL